MVGSLMALPDEMEQDPSGSSQVQILSVPTPPPPPPLFLVSRK